MSKKDLYQEALRKAMKLCASREICRSEAETRLGKWGLNDAEIKSVLDSLERERFIDEKRYASAFAREKFRYNKWGKIKISSMLAMKGISEDIISEALETIDEGEYLATLRKLLVSHRKTIRAASEFELKGKLARYAASKGFESHLVYEILNNME